MVLLGTIVHVTRTWHGCAVQTLLWEGLARARQIFFMRILKRLLEYFPSSMDLDTTKTQNRVHFFPYSVYCLVSIASRITSPLLLLSFTSGIWLWPQVYFGSISEAAGLHYVIQHLFSMLSRCRRVLIKRRLAPICCILEHRDSVIVQTSSTWIAISYLWLLTGCSLPSGYHFHGPRSFFRTARFEAFSMKSVRFSDYSKNSVFVIDGLLPSGY